MCHTTWYGSMTVTCDFKRLTLPEILAMIIAAVYDNYSRSHPRPRARDQGIGKYIPRGADSRDLIASKVRHNVSPVYSICYHFFSRHGKCLLRDRQFPDLWKRRAGAGNWSQTWLVRPRPAHCL